MNRKELLEQINLSVGDYPLGQNKTVVPFLTIVKRDQATPVVCAMLNQAFCLIIQGAKVITIGADELNYQAGDFLASMIDIPASGRISRASGKQPYLGLTIEFTRSEIIAVIEEAKVTVKSKEPRTNTIAFVGSADLEILELFAKLVSLLKKPDEAPFVSQLIKKELLFRLLTGKYGHLFYQPALFQAHVDHVGKIIDWIRANYSTSFTVKSLAQKHHMSVSALHHKFKTLTSMGPLQYQKNIRLQEAKRLMLTGRFDATSAALEVGYESPSQFNREYRRLFGLPPLKDIKITRKNSVANSLGK